MVFDHLLPLLISPESVHHGVQHCPWLLVMSESTSEAFITPWSTIECQRWTLLRTLSRSTKSMNWSQGTDMRVASKFHKLWSKCSPRWYSSMDISMLMHTQVTSWSDLIPRMQQSHSWSWSIMVSIALCHLSSLKYEIICGILWSLSTTARYTRLGRNSVSENIIDICQSYSRSEQSTAEREWEVEVSLQKKKSTSKTRMSWISRRSVFYSRNSLQTRFSYSKRHRW